MKKRGSILLFSILSLFLFLPTNTFASPSVSSADFNYLWRTDSITTDQNLNYSNYTLGTWQPFGQDSIAQYYITRIGTGINFTGTSGEPFVTARVKFYISYYPPSTYGEEYLNAQCYTESAGMTNLTAIKESQVNAYNANSQMYGSEIICSYSYRTSTPYYQFFGITSSTGSFTYRPVNSLNTQAKVELLDLSYSNDNSSNEQIIAQNGIIINQNQQMIDKQQQMNDKLDEANQKADEAENTRKGIWETIKDIPNQIGELLKSLFVPDDDYFSNKFTELSDNIEGILGFLSYPYTLVTNVFDYFMTIEDTGEYVIKWDDVKVPNFEEYSIIKAGSYDFSVLLQNEKIRLLRNIAFAFINALLTLAFLQLCHNQYSRIFGGDISTTEFISVTDVYDVDYDTGEVTGMKRYEKKTTRRDVN